MRALIDNVVVRLSLYYAILVAVFLALLEYFPWIGEAVAKERARAVATALVAPAVDAPTTAAASILLTDVEVIAPIALTLLEIGRAHV